MINASFSLSETGSVRDQNQDSYLLDVRSGLFAVADGLGGLPNGERASKTTLEVITKKLHRNKHMSLRELLTDVNEETRKIGYNLDASGFGTTLTMARYLPEREVLQIAHVGDSAAYLVHEGQVEVITEEHTVAARMVAERWEDATEAIPMTAHHTLTQCIGQDLYIDPQVVDVPVQPGDRFFLFTDGVTKPILESTLHSAISGKESLEQICQALTFRIEAAGSPDNYTVVAVEF